MSASPVVVSQTIVLLLSLAVARVMWRLPPRVKRHGRLRRGCLLAGIAAVTLLLAWPMYVAQYEPYRPGKDASLAYRIRAAEFDGQYASLEFAKNSALACVAMLVIIAGRRPAESHP